MTTTNLELYGGPFDGLEVIFPGEAPFFYYRSMGDRRHVYQQESKGKYQFLESRDYDDGLPNPP